MNTIRLDKYPGRHIRYGNKQFLYFGGTSYLAVQSLPEFQSILTRYTKSYGTNYGSSRLSNVQLKIYEEAEAVLKQWVGSESGFTMSSGYLAGQLLASYFAGKKYRLFYAPNVHSSLQYGDCEVNENYNALKTALDNYLNENRENTPVILFDTIDLTIDTFPIFQGIKSLPLESCILIADDSHGIGLVGTEGNGCFQELSELKPKELLVCCSLGKSLGLQAGAIFGSKPRVEMLMSTAFFSGASPASAASMATLIEAMPLYSSQRKKLIRNIDQFSSLLKRNDIFKWLAHYPVFEYSDEDLSQYLFEHRICVTNFNYPAERDSWQSRIVISAIHHQNDIEKLADLVNKFY